MLRIPWLLPMSMTHGGIIRFWIQTGAKILLRTLSGISIRSVIGDTIMIRITVYCYWKVVHADRKHSACSGLNRSYRQKFFYHVKRSLQNVKKVL